MPSVLRLARSSEPFERVGHVTDIKGLAIEAHGPDAFLGEICLIKSADVGVELRAEVVGFKNGRVCLAPLAHPHGISVGAEVVATGASFECPVGESFLGRVVSALGAPIDGGPAIQPQELRSLHAPARPLMTRQRIRTVIPTGVQAIDTFLPLGRGQRVGLFAGSGVGKSTLLGMITKQVQADVNVIALIGERGREVREFVEDHLGDNGLSRTVVVVAAADAPASLRVNCAYYAMAMAEYFRDQGKSVLLTMDSLTRLAMARREIGLATGEPPTSRGYTPSIFSELPALCERCGNDEGEGSITGIFTVLVEGDDFNEPVSDTARATLDGHIMLSRDLASRGQYPPIDVLSSVSRSASALWTDAQRNLVTKALGALSLYERNRQLIEIGAHRAGVNAELDQAISLHDALLGFLRQKTSDHMSVGQAWQALEAVMRSRPESAR